PASAARANSRTFGHFHSAIKSALESCPGGLSQMTPGQGQKRTPQPRGRPSVVAQFTPQITQWLRENPEVSGVEILRRVQRVGYRGGKSALYELLKQLRTSRSPVRVKTTASGLQPETAGSNDPTKR